VLAQLAFILLDSYGCILFADGLFGARFFGFLVSWYCDGTNLVGKDDQQSRLASIHASMARAWRRKLGPVILCSFVPVRAVGSLSRF